MQFYESFVQSGSMYSNREWKVLMKVAVVVFFYLFLFVYWILSDRALLN